MEQLPRMGVIENTVCLHTPIPTFPLAGLFYAHIFQRSQFPTLAEGLNPLPSAQQGDRTGLGFGPDPFHPPKRATTQAAWAREPAR